MDIKKAVNELSMACLEENEHQNYTDDEIMDATVVFSHFIMDRIYSNNSGTLPPEELMKIVHESGKAVRDLLIAVVGIDPHDAMKKYGQE